MTRVFGWLRSAAVLGVLGVACACASSPDARGPEGPGRTPGPDLGVARAGDPNLEAAQDDQDYTIGPQDTLRIEVFNQPDLGGRYTVETDGALSFPLIGRIAAGGSTVRAFERALADRLAAGYFKDPRVTVSVEEYNSQRVFIIGEVRQPGAYALAGEMRLIELLALAGSATPAAAGEAVVVRSGSGANRPVRPGDGRVAETLRVDLDALETGDLAQNVRLRDGDTVFLPEADAVYVFGEVRNPGRYPIRNGTIVLQALSLAGGSTEFAALNRVRIVRVVDGEQVEIRVGLNDRVRPDDIIRVPERFF